MKLKALVLTVLAGVALLCAASPITSEPSSTFREIGKIPTGIVSVDLTSIQVDRDRVGMPIASMIIRVRHTKPLAGALLTERGMVFSCFDKSAMVVVSTTYGDKEVVLQTDVNRAIVPWVKGNGDRAVDLVMTKLCAGYRPPLPRGVREA